MIKQRYIQKNLRDNYRELYDLNVRLNRDVEKPLSISFLPEDGANYLLSVASDLTHRSFIIVRYEDTQEIKPNVCENIKSVEVLSFSTTSISVSEVLDYISLIVGVYSANNQLMILIRRNDSGSIINEHIRRLYRGVDRIKLFPTSKYSESGEIVIDKIGHGWKQKKQDEELCQSCMKDSLVNKYFLLSSNRSQQCFELQRFKDPTEKDSKDSFWIVWGMVAFVRHNRLNIFQEDYFDELEHEEKKFIRKIEKRSYQGGGVMAF